MKLQRTYLVLVLLSIPFVLADNERTEHHIKSLIEWVRSKGGFFHTDLVEIRKVDENSDYYGMFALQDMEEKTEFLKIPKECLITAGGVQVGDYYWFQDDENEWYQAGIQVGDYYWFQDEGKHWYNALVTHVDNEKMTVDVVFENGMAQEGIDMNAAVKDGDISMECGTIRNLIKEMKLGDESDYAPYVNYILDQKSTNIPSFWSAAGKAFLLHVQGDLPPHDLIGWSWQRVCGGKKDPFEEKAAMAQITRGWSDFMVPIYDMMNHRGGNWTNTENTYMMWNADIRVRVTKDIKAGDQLYNNYLMDTNSNQLYAGYGTAELFRDYGFIEQFPQRWFFFNQDVHFALHHNDDKFEVKWHTRDKKPPPLQNIEALEAEKKRLLEINKNYFHSTPHPTIVAHEWDAIHQYLKALVLAMTQAIDAANLGNCDKLSGKDYIDCKYDTLDFKPDPLDYIDMTCDFGRKMDFPNHQNLENFQTPYQHIEIYQNPQDRDTCFSLDGIVQICGSYRPHYHEMVVHSSARFLNQVKRVVFVGGGDSMLLHEILKYESLELVIGLEIDQTITRKSFQYFGTQPHWDNDKVQWWYGDAAKSLLMLPKSYFGSFDLVLVDLSETVMSITVTEGLDIMAALGLLLKPEGILVKNEIYLDKLSEVFQHTLQLHFYDVPVICSQALIFASNSINFFDRQQTDHGVEILWQKHLPKLGSKGEHVDYAPWHDYRYNPNYKKMCEKDNKVVNENNMTEQIKSPGILMILETENVDTKSISEIVKDITNALHKIAGVNVLSSRINLSDDNPMAIIAMNEGYVLARPFPEYSYIAFDLHLWSAFELMDTIKQTLKASLNVDDQVQTSSYRIVAGGIFGATDWKNDEKKRGPMFTQHCNTKNDTEEKPIDAFNIASIANFLSDEILFNAVIDESVSLIADIDVKVLVVCGYAGTPCGTLAKLANHQYVDAVVEMWTCPGIDDESAGQMNNCEMKAAEFLKNETSSDERPTLLKLYDTDKLAVGDRILTSVPALEQTIGTVRAINPDGSVYVTYDNGFVIFNLKRHYVHRYVKNDSLFYRKKFRAIFLDPSVPFAMGRILYNIFKVDQNKKNFLKTNFFVISLFPDENNNNDWRGHLLDRFRTDIVKHDPLFSANILFKHLKGSKMNIGVTSSGNHLFINHVKHAISTIDRHSLGAISSIVQFIKGGQFNFQPGFKPVNFYLPKDYDQSSPFDQWKSQHSLGRQTVFQLERKLTEDKPQRIEEGERLKVGDEVMGNYLNEGTWFEGKITKVHSDNTYDVLYEDGDPEHQVSIQQLVKLVEVPVNDAPLTSLLIKSAFRQALSSFTNVCTANNSCVEGEEDDIYEFTSLGEGVLFVALWSSGSAVVLWDGRTHVDVNLFTRVEEEDAHNMFVNHFLELIPSLIRTLTDTQPRGVGRVVNFENDRHDKTPKWANK